MKENYKELISLVKLAWSTKIEGVRYWQMRKPSNPTDYKEITRNGFQFSYKEQSEILELDSVVKKAKTLAKALGLYFAEN